MELAFQWDLVEDEVSTLFGGFLDTIKHELGYLKDRVKSKPTSNQQQSTYLYMA